VQAVTKRRRTGNDCPRPAKGTSLPAIPVEQQGQMGKPLPSIPSPIQTVTVGSGIAPDQPLARLAG